MIYVGDMSILQLEFALNTCFCYASKSEFTEEKGQVSAGMFFIKPITVYELSYNNFGCMTCDFCKKLV